MSMLYLVILGGITVTSGVIFWRTRPTDEALEPAPAPAPASAPSFVRVGGVTVDLRDWSPEVLDKIRETYFRPSIKGKYVQVLDMSATCPRNHVTRDRILLLSRDLSTSKELSGGLLRGKADLRCDECGKTARLSGRSVVWEGPVDEWDGSV